MQSSIHFSPHRDVLEAVIPLEGDGAKEARHKLLEECKNRGRAAVQAQAWPDAVALYKKALECCTSKEDAEQAQQKTEIAILNSNLSLAAGKMHQWIEMALPAAQRAVEADPSYVKGWWRLGQAHAACNDYGPAVKAMQEALQREPNNKALQKELEKLKKLQAEKPSSSTAPKKTTTTTTSSSASKTTTPSSTKSAAEPMSIDDDEEDKVLFSKSEPVKGYKIVNGKKTSYFHQELSEDAKKLMGDIQPKRLDASGMEIDTTSTPAATSGTSAWNQAGTWEERDCTVWAKDSMESLLLSKAVWQDDSAAAKLTKAIVTGTASVVMVRGKKRYLYELHITVHWTLDITSDDTLTGKLEFREVDGSCTVGEPYEAEGFVVEGSPDPQNKALAERTIYKGGLRPILHQCIDDWVKLFQETY